MSYLRDDANLQGYWRLESDGSDETDNNYDLTTTSAPSYVAGKFNNGGDFELDSSNFLSIAEASCTNLAVAGDQTWGCWVKFETINGCAMMGKAKSDASQWGSLRLSESHPTFSLMGTHVPSQVIGSGTVSTGTWYFICGVYDKTNSKFKVWQNGTKTEVTVTTAGVYNSGGDFGIGRMGNFTGWPYFDGIIDDAFFFNRALTDAEVGELYNSGTGTELATMTAPLGPANLKTFNGLAKASIKTINGLAIASVKSINGLV